VSNVVDIVIRGRDMVSSTFAGIDRVAGSAFSALGRRAMSLLAPLGQMATKLAGVGSLAISLGPQVIAAGQAVFAVGQAAVAAAPALAAFAVAGLVVSSALKAIFAEGSAARLALQPIADGFKKAGENASEAAAKGIRPFVESFNAKFWPEINHTFTQIGESVGVIVGKFMEWGSSAEGLQTINGILHPIWQSVDRLREPILQVGIAFAQMLGRIMGVSLAAGTSGLTDIMYRLAAAMDGVNAETVSEGLGKLKDTASTVGDVIGTVVEWIKKLANWYEIYQTQFWMLADALALVAIAFGGPVTVIIAAVGLVIRHFDDIKAAYQAVMDYFTKKPEGMGFIDDLKTAAAIVLPAVKQAFNDLVASVGPTISRIVTLIKNDLIPAFGDFLAAAAPVAAWFINIFGPWVTNTMNNVLNIIRGVINIIIGIFQVFTGVLTGDWSKAWSGIQRIIEGMVGILGAIASQIVNNITAIFRTLGGLVSGAIQAGISLISTAARNIFNAIKDGIGDLAGLGRRVAGNLIDGLVGFIKGAAGRVAGAIKSILPSPGSVLRGLVPGFASGGVVGGLAGIGRAASGGARGGLVEVGERGRELVRLPFGSSVIPHGQSEAMLSGGGRGSGKILLELRAGASKLDQLLLEILRSSIRVKGGNVQVVLGS